MSSSIRTATPRDLPELERLLTEAEARGIHHDMAHRGPGQHHLFVVDAPHDGLAAAALVAVQGSRGHLEMLVVDLRYHAMGLEQRVRNVAELVCRAFGASRMAV